MMCDLFSALFTSRPCFVPVKIYLLRLCHCHAICFLRSSLFLPCIYANHTHFAEPFPFIRTGCPNRCSLFFQTLFYLLHSYFLDFVILCSVNSSYVSQVCRLAFKFRSSIYIIIGRIDKPSFLFYCLFPDYLLTRYLQLAVRTLTALLISLFNSSIYPCFVFANSFCKSRNAKWIPFYLPASFPPFV